MKHEINISNDKDVLRIALKDARGKQIKDTDGSDAMWVFDLADVELPLKMNKMEVDHNDNLKWIKAQFIAIDKREDRNIGQSLTANEKAKFETFKEFYDREIKAINNFLGDRGVEKFLAGRKPYWGMFDDIVDGIQQIEGLFDKTMENLTDRVMNRYKEEEDNVLQ